jgi:hypothetical protein
VNFSQRIIFSSSTASAVGLALHTPGKWKWPRSGSRWLATRVDQSGLLLMMRFVCALFFGGLLFAIFAITDAITQGLGSRPCSCSSATSSQPVAEWAVSQQNGLPRHAGRPGLLTISVMPGQLHAAMAKVHEKWDNDYPELGTGHPDIRLGKPRRFRIWRIAWGAEMTSFVGGHPVGALGVSGQVHQSTRWVRRRQMAYMKRTKLHQDGLPIAL